MFSTGRITKIRGCELFTGSCRFPGCIALAVDKNMKILRKVNAMPLMFDFNIIAFFLTASAPMPPSAQVKIRPWLFWDRNYRASMNFPANTEEKLWHLNC